MIAIFIVKSESYNDDFHHGSTDVSINVRKDDVLLSDFGELLDYVEHYLNERGMSTGPDKDRNFIVKYQRKWIKVIQCLGDYIIAIDCDRFQYGMSDSCNFNVNISDLHRWFKYYG